MKTTKENFKLFKKECKKWIKIFGLTGWEVCYKQENNSGSRGWFAGDIQGRICSIALCPNWEGESITDDKIKRVAFHEVCELLLARLDEEAKSRYATSYNIDEERHEVIRILENVIWKPKK